MPESGVIRVSAVNFMREGHELRSGTKGRHVRVSVEDQGGGIPARQLQKIFDPFFTTKEKGRGLGLTTAFSIIKRHDGQISVESDVGVGTTFHIYLPASEKVSPVVERAKEDIARGQGKVLLIDDEEIIRNSTGEGLRRLGYEVEVARDGEEGIPLYESAMRLKHPFDAVIMDLTVPGGMGGRKAIRELVKIDPETNVIVSSGYSEDPVMSDYREHGFRGVVAKPYRIEDLGRVLREIITGKKK
jgi:CheY-like chemotaxis protein